jgi:sugar O-acyltransferase (sialic acid O-acetyltransferase NeuD family)
MKDLYLIGGGGFATEVLYVIERINDLENRWSSIFIIDDNIDVHSKIRNYEVKGNLQYLLSIHHEVDIVITINNPEIRKEIVQFLKKEKNNFHFPNIFDSSSIVDNESIVIGEGNVIMHYVILSTQLQIGNFNVFNSYAGIGHDSLVGDFNTFNPRVAISGNVIIGNLNSFGVNSTVLQNKRIGSHNNIWLNSAIVKNIKDNGTYFGVPAKKVEL